MKISNLTSSEEQLMQVIWSLDSAFMRDIMTAYPEPKPHQNTVSTFLKILVEKDFLGTEKHGRIFKYIPTIQFQDYRRHCLHEFFTSFYENQPETFLEDLKRGQFINLDSSEIIGSSSGLEIPEPKTDIATSILKDWEKEVSKKDKKKDKKKKKKNKKD